MADEEYLGLPLLGEMLGIPDVPPRRRESDLLDYYLGPTGIPDRLGAASDLLNPIVGLSDAMYYSGRAFSPDFTPEERREAAMEAVLGTSLAAAPIPAAKVLQRYMRAMPRGTALADEADEAASAVAETLMGATIPAGQVVGTVGGEPFLAVNPLRDEPRYEPELDYDPYAGLVFDMDGRPEIYNHRVIVNMNETELRNAVQDLVFGQDFDTAAELSRVFTMRGMPDPLDEILLDVMTAHQEVGNWDAAAEVDRVIGARLTDQGFDPYDPANLDFDGPDIGGDYDDVVGGMYYSSNTPLLADEATPFFSTVQRALQDLPQDKYGDTGQFLKALERAGARPGEIDALDLKSLALQGGPVDRRVISEQLASRITNEGLGDVRILDADNEYQSYFPSLRQPTNYRERVIALPLSEYPQLGYGSNLLGESRPAKFEDFYRPPHFAELAEETDMVPIMHYRTGIFETDDGLRTLHLGEIQSDIVQGQRKQARMKAIYDRNKELFDQYEAMQIDGPPEGLSPSDVMENLMRGLRNTPEIDPNKDNLNEIISDLTQNRTFFFKPPSAKLPVAGTTDKFTQLGIRGALMDALDADVDYITFPFPDEVQQATFGTAEGQTEYYGKIVPKNLREVLKDIKKRSGMDIPISTDISTSRINPDSMGDGSAPVRFGIRLTPGVKEAIRKAGLPLYRDGGLVTA